MVESIEPQLGRFRLFHEDGRREERTIRWLIQHPDVRQVGGRRPDRRKRVAGQPRSRADLTETRLKQAMIRAEHVREAATGFRDGHPSRARPSDSCLIPNDRCQALKVPTGSCRWHAGTWPIARSPR